MPKQQQEYQVQALIGKRRKKNQGTVQYRVLWKGYPKEQATWEPQDHLENVSYMIEQFNRKVQQKGQQAKNNQTPQNNPNQKQQKLIQEGQKIANEIKKKEQNQTKLTPIKKPNKLSSTLNTDDQYTPNQNDNSIKPKPKNMIQRSNNHIVLESSNTPNKSPIAQKKQIINGINKSPIDQKLLGSQKNGTSPNGLNLVQSNMAGLKTSQLSTMNGPNKNIVSGNNQNQQKNGLVRKNQPLGPAPNHMNGPASKIVNQNGNKIIQQKDQIINNNKPIQKIQNPQQSTLQNTKAISSITPKTNLQPPSFSDSQQEQDSLSIQAQNYEITGIYLTKNSSNKQKYGYTVIDKKNNRRMCLSRKEIIKINPKVLIRFYQKMVAFE